jgi:alpha-galactosidase
MALAIPKRRITRIRRIDIHQRKTAGISGVLISMTTATKLIDAPPAMGHREHTQDADSQLGLPGEFSRPIKLTVLGAGSGFTPRLVSDILQTPGSKGGEIALVDIDERRLSIMHNLIKQVIEVNGVTNWTVSASTDRTEVIGGSHYVICCIEVSGTDCVAWDNDIPLKYGIDQCIGDTIGPGGLFKAMRTTPVFLEVLRDIERLCPGAYVLNYTNPMNIMCLSAGRNSPVSVVGLCHSVQSTSRKLAKDAGVPYEQMAWECAGINHLSWFTKLQHNEKDLYPKLIDKVKRHDGDIYESDPVRYDMMLHFGAFITESSGHLSEYLPYYRKNADTIKTYCRDEYLGESQFYANNWPKWRIKANEDYQAMLRGDQEITWKRSWEYASWIIEAREKDTPVRIYGNVMNNDGTGHGTLISNLPADGCVEVACMVDGNGIHPTRFGALPPQMAHICASNMGMFDLAANACINKSKEAAIHALLLDPLTAAVATPVQIKKMAIEMFDAQADYLPGFR